MTSPAPLMTSLPYGVRDVKLTRYADAAGTILGPVSVDLPNAQTFSFSEEEDFDDLRGDDRTVSSRGQGATVKWELESGGISLEAWQVITGGQIIDDGISPKRTRTYRKCGRDQRPWFRVDGQAISDSGGDLHCIVYRCRLTDNIEGDFEDGKFFMGKGKGEGFPLLNDADGTDLLYDFVQNETATRIPLSGLTNPSIT